MGKIKESDISSPEEAKKLKRDILAIKNSLNLTFHELNKLLGEQCSSSTLQIRTTHPSKRLSKKLLIKLNNSIDNLKIKEQIKSKKIDSLQEIKREAIEKITAIIDDMLSKV